MPPSRHRSWPPGSPPGELAADRQRHDALLWNFTVLGGAASQLPDELKDSYRDLPWAQPTRLRNRIVHGYWSIDLDVLLTTASEQLPAFTVALKMILGQLEPDAGV